MRSGRVHALLQCVFSCLVHSACRIQRRLIGPSITQRRILRSRAGSVARDTVPCLQSYHFGGAQNLDKRGPSCFFEAFDLPLIRFRSAALPCEPGIMELSLQDEAEETGSMVHDRYSAWSAFRWKGLWTCRVHVETHCIFRFCFRCFFRCLFVWPRSSLLASTRFAVAFSVPFRLPFKLPSSVRFLGSDS